MKVTTPSGREVEVHRRWLPWRPRTRQLQADWIDLSGGASDPLSFLVLIVLGLVAGVVLAVVLTFALLASEFLLVLVLLVPLLGLARLFWVLPWVIDVHDEDRRLGVTRVRGWRASEERIQELVDDYRLGRDPFASDSPAA